MDLRKILIEEDIQFLIDNDINLEIETQKEYDELLYKLFRLDWNTLEQKERVYDYIFDYEENKFK
ncbi:MAG: hypothetical protein E7161_04510 [Firmicutes bacterium]|nr:hypothetical protein [Bacillota bacterium]